MEGREISQAVIRRLPRYYRYLGELLENGVERISSNDLSKKMHVTASQIRQDLNNFGGFGQQGYGYNVKYLYTEIGKILGLEEDHDMIIIGPVISDTHWRITRRLKSGDLYSKESLMSIPH